MPAVKCVYFHHAGDAAVNAIEGPCRVQYVYTLNSSVRDEQALELYDETTDTGTSMSHLPAMSIVTPKDASFSFCRQWGGGVLTGWFGFYIRVALKAYNKPSGIVWKAPRGGVVFNRGVSLLPTGGASADIFDTTIFYTPVGRKRI